MENNFKRNYLSFEYREYKFVFSKAGFLVSVFRGRSISCGELLEQGLKALPSRYVVVGSVFDDGASRLGDSAQVPV